MDVGYLRQFEVIREEESVLHEELILFGPLLRLLYLSCMVLSVLT